MRLKQGLKRLLAYTRPVVNLRKERLDRCLIETLSTYKHEVVLLNIPVQHCVTGVFWKLDLTNPFVRSLFENDSTILKTYYQTVQPPNVQALLREELTGEWGQMPPYAYVFPWEEKTPEEALHKRQRVALQENKNQGKHNLTLQQGGHTDFGPVSATKLNLELSRTKRLYKAIKNKGYHEKTNRDDGGISGYFLCGKSDWRFYITSGKHRAYVLASLGFLTIPVMLKGHKVVWEGHKAQWPHVRNKYYTTQEATRVFKRFFD